MLRVVCGIVAESFRARVFPRGGGARVVHCELRRRVANFIAPAEALLCSVERVVESKPMSHLMGERFPPTRAAAAWHHAAIQHNPIHRLPLVVVVRERGPAKDVGLRAARDVHIEVARRVQRVRRLHAALLRAAIAYIEVCRVAVQHGRVQCKRKPCRGEGAVEERYLRCDVFIARGVVAVGNDEVYDDGDRDGQLWRNASACREAPPPTPGAGVAPLEFLQPRLRRSLLRIAHAAVLPRAVNRSGGSAGCAGGTEAARAREARNRRRRGIVAATARRRPPR